MLIFGPGGRLFDVVRIINGLPSNRENAVNPAAEIKLTQILRNRLFDLA